MIKGRGNEFLFDLYSAESFGESDYDERKQKLRRALVNAVNQDLTKKQKYYIILYYRDGLNCAEIAKRCKVRTSTVTRTLVRAKKRLFNYLKYV